MPRVLCVWFPRWPIQRLCVAHPELKGTAVALHVEQRNRGEQIVVCSTQAARVGVSPGMPLAEARTLLEGNRRSRRGTLSHFLPLDPAADRETLRRLCWELLAYAPHVGLEESDAPESLLLDISGCAALFGGEAELVRQAAQTLRSRGYEVRLALADTLGAAWGATRFSPNRITLIASGRHGPFLEGLPPAALRLPENILSLLEELGLRTVRELAALPRTSLPSRFGSDILKRLDQAFGHLPEPFAGERPSEPVEASLSFEFPLDDRRDVETVMLRLLGEVLGRLRTAGRVAQRLSVQLSHGLDSTTPLEIGLVSPTAMAKRWEDALRLTWERTNVVTGILGVTLRAINPIPLPARPKTLFDDGRETSTSEWEALLERFSNRLGEQAVVHWEPVDGHVPERTFRGVPVTRPRERHDRPTGHSNSRSMLLRPLHLSSSPRSVVVVSAPDGSPVRIRWPGFSSIIAHCWGPERIETAWWSERTVRRDYYRVETTEGRRFWLFCDLPTRRWFLHGTFD